MERKEYDKVILIAILWDMYEEDLLEDLGKEIDHIHKFGKMSQSLTQTLYKANNDLENVIENTIPKIQSLYQSGIDLANENKADLFEYTGMKPKETDIAEMQARETARDIIVHSKALCTIDKYGRPVALNTSINNILNKALQTARETKDFHSVMRDTIKEFGGSGIRVNFGGGVTRSIESVVRSNLLWGLKQTHLQYEREIGEMIGCDGVEIDWHLNQRPSHIFMGGRQYSIGEGKEVNGKYYPSVDDTTQGGGLSVNMALQDYGCLHYETSIILGVSAPRYTEAEIEQLNKDNEKPIEFDGKSKTGYQWQQVMRALEREYRKNNLIMKVGKGDRQLIREYKDKNAKIKAKYDAISKATGIKEDYNRFI